MIRKSYLDALNEHLSIKEVVEQAGVTLQKSGSEYKGLCTFHDENTPSMFVNEEKGKFHCHGCNAGGSALHFIKEFYQISHFPDVVQKAVEISGFRAIEYEDSDSNDFSKEQSVAKAAHKYLTQVYRGALPHSKPAIEYLQARGLTMDDVKKWEIGFSPAEDWYFSANSCKGRFTIDQLVDSGIQKRKEGSKRTYDLFRGRIIFPIKSTNGATIAFAGRKLPTANDQAKSPKYINSPETCIFNKSRVLFGLHQATTSRSPEPGTINVVEGYMDVIGCHRAEFTNTVGTMGVALSEDNVVLLFKRYDKIRLLFDGDSAGIDAAVNALKNALPHVTAEKRITISILPSGLDPDEFIQQDGKDSFNRILRNEQPVSLFLKNYFSAQLGTIRSAEDHAAIIGSAKKYTDLIQDELCRSAFENDLLGSLGKGLNPKQLLELMPTEAKEMISQASSHAVKLAGAVLKDSSWVELAPPGLLGSLSDSDSRVINFAQRVSQHCLETGTDTTQAFSNSKTYLVEYLLAHAEPQARNIMNIMQSMAQTKTKDNRHAQSLTLS